MRIEKTVQGVRSLLNAVRTDAAKRIGFVPTMGNLHAGHIQLVKEAKRRCDVVVVSIFVNPTQFGAGEDFERYPRTLEADSVLLTEAGCDVVFMPDVNIMYGGDVPQLTTVHVHKITQDLCGASRVGHFDGVATVVAKLFNIIAPHDAFFGEKDFQQLAVIRALTKDLFFPIDIHGIPTERAEDGLALSSRNGYLSTEERAIAPTLHRILQETRQRLHTGATLDLLHVERTLTAACEQLTQAGFVVDYLTLKNQDLSAITAQSKDVVLLVAAKLGHTRLIDNITFVLSS